MIFYWNCGSHLPENPRNTWQMQSITQNYVDAKNAKAFPVRCTDWLAACNEENL